MSFAPEEVQVGQCYLVDGNLRRVLRIMPEAASSMNTAAPGARGCGSLECWAWWPLPVRLNARCLAIGLQATRTAIAPNSAGSADL